MGQARTIGQRYELRGELASGGMATVHLARQLGAGGFARIVAIKRLHERLARDPEFVEMFLDEARLVARIRHPNVVQTLDVVAETTADGASELFIVMEYIHGESLLRVLANARKRDEPVPLPIAAAIIIGVLHGLHEAHIAKSEAGQPLSIVHRDVSPPNILIGIDGIARVLDFGVAKASERVTSTEQGKVKGKLAYMAPEQLAGERVDRRTDIYAAGIVIWEILTGQKLFVAANEGALVKLVLDSPIPAPSTRNGNVTDAFDAVIMRALARDPATRFATALEFANAVTAAVPPAATTEVGAWVRATCAAEIEEKTRKIASIEAPVTPPPAPRKASTQVVPPELAKTSIAPPPLNRTVPMPPAIAPKPQKRTALLVAGSAPAPTPGTPKKANRVGTVVALVLGALLLAAITLGVVKRRSKRIDVVASASVSAVLPPPPTCPAGMAAIPAGTFTMGNEDHLDEKPSHKVTLHAFCMDRFEVSVTDYKACSDHGACLRAPQTNNSPDITDKERKVYDPLCNGRDQMRGHHPINCVDWSAAQGYCASVDKRLPTEAEWEYVARGGDDRTYSWGEDPPSAKRLNGCGTECVAWQNKNKVPATGVLYSEDDGYANTSPSGSFPAGQSRWGVEDLSGNVSEWVSDFMALYERADVTDPEGPESGKERAFRGGSWMTTNKDTLRPTVRSGMLPGNRHHSVGFRCAKSQKL